MNFQKSIIKKISGLLIVSILAINFSFLTIPNKASAQFTDPVLATFLTLNATQITAFYSLIAPKVAVEQTAQDIWTIAWQKVIEPVLGTLFKTFGMLLINDLTEATVDWINNGFQGNPAFIDNPGKFLTNIADQTVGDMILNDPSLNFLCAPFQMQIKLALASSLPTFQSKISCTLTSIANNYQNALSDVRARTWDDWIQLTQPQNDPIGAYLIAQNELQARIGDKQIGFSQQINMGNGALNYENCSEEAFNKKTGERVPGSIRFYQGNQFVDSLSNVHSSTDPNTYKTSCKITTPGNTIASMLGAKANSDQTTSQLAVAFGNGIDSVLNALLSKVVQTAITKLAQGALGGGSNSPENLAYRADISSVAQQAQAEYNNAVNNVSNTSYAPSGIFESYDAAFSTTSNPSSNVSVPFSDGFVQNTTTNDNSSSFIDNSRANAMSVVNSYLKAETAYQNTLLQASTTLSNARAIFVKARYCNNTTYYSMANSLRANLIDSNVIKNIDGIGNTDSYRVLAQIPWNLATTSKMMEISNTHIDILNKTANNIGSATSTMGITDAMVTVNSTSFNTDPQTSMITNIKTWLKGVQGMYNTKQCPINLDKIIGTSTTATSTKK